MPSIPDSNGKKFQDSGIRITLHGVTNLLNVIDITRYNTLEKTLRITALVFHFVKKLRGYTNSQNTITTMDLNYVCVTLFKYVQQIHYGEIISTLKHKDKRQTNPPPIIQQLELYLDDNNLIRYKGKTAKHITPPPPQPYSTKCPVMIPAESYLATLIVRVTHLIVLHGGARDTTTQLLQSFWIPKGQQLLKKELKRCVNCRKVVGLPLRSVSSPPLPEIRVTGSQPFRVTRVDYAGSLYIRSNFIELQTILTEVEATLNSRPLTFAYTDINDGPPLTPSHLLYAQCL